ncbi:MAG: hypothetical protein V4696_07705 [Pseudomonadota bacterium]
MAKAPKVPFKYGRKVCVFCGGTPITEEHVWPQWAHHLLPASVYHGRFIATGRKSQPLTIKKNYDRQGAVTTFRVPRVCGPCNSGWMGDYEIAVRPFLEPMMRGAAVMLFEAQQKALTEYITYKAIVLDWADEEPLTTPEIGAAFLTDRTIPKGLIIYLFDCFEGDWRAAFRSHFVGLAPEAKFVGSHMPKNTKSLAIGFGSLFVFAMFTPAQFDLNIEFDPPPAVRLWPSADSIISWPPPVPITSKQAEFIATTLARVDDAPNVLRVD